MEIMATKRELRKKLRNRKVHTFGGWVSGAGWDQPHRRKGDLQQLFDTSKALGKNEFFDIKGKVRVKKF